MPKKVKRYMCTCGWGTDSLDNIHEVISGKARHHCPVCGELTGLKSMDEAKLVKADEQYNVVMLPGGYGRHRDCSRCAQM